MKGEYWLINSAFSLENCIHQIRKDFEDHGNFCVQIKKGKQRSLAQNSALHLYCEWLAEALNDAGLSLMQVLKHDAEIPWSGALVKEHLWRPIQEVMTGKKSSTEPSKTEYIDIYETLNRHIAQTHGVSVEWPCRNV